ncbi:MAG TPA: septum formation initiator family protein [Chitinophagaceae bacterium]|jgi:cell division protein FtsB|nr:septum formation initiator family protein [Chitinophagaceae bacterium]
MKLLSFIPQFLKNKFFLTAIAFAIWMIFFDEKDLFTQREWRKDLTTLQESKKYFITEIAKERLASEELKSNPSAIEKFAREKYGMKRDDEDVFIVRPAGKERGNTQ